MRKKNIVDTSGLVTSSKRKCYHRWRAAGYNGIDEITYLGIVKDPGPVQQNYVSREAGKTSAGSAQRYLTGYLFLHATTAKRNAKMSRRRLLASKFEDLESRIDKRNQL